MKKKMGYKKTEQWTYEREQGDVEGRDEQKNGKVS
jgi:hypothetical protein